MRGSNAWGSRRRELKLSPSEPVSRNSIDFLTFSYPSLLLFSWFSVEWACCIQPLCMPTFLHAVTLGTLVLLTAFTLLAAGQSQLVSLPPSPLAPDLTDSLRLLSCWTSLARGYA